MCERTYTNSELTIIKNFKKSNPHICAYCNKPIPSTETVTIDHKIPVSKGGETVSENLTISCYPCNREKDDMTVEEYVIYKQKQGDILENYEVNIVINELVIMHNNIIKRIGAVNDEYNLVDKEITNLQQDIMWSKFNASEGYLFNKRMSELLLRREELRILKIGFTQLHVQLGHHRKNIIDTKDRIQVEVKSANRLYLKRYAYENCKRSNKLKGIKVDQLVQISQVAR